MGIRSRLLAASQALFGEQKISGSLSAWASIFQRGLDSWPYGDALTQPYAQHPTVYAAVSAIATNLASLPLEFFPDSDDSREYPDPEALPLQLIRKPNPLMAGSQLIEATVVNLELYGNAFWFKDGLARRSASGPRFPTILECWDPQRVRPRLSGDTLLGWEYRTQNTTVIASTEQVCHFKFFNPYDDVWGLGPLQAANVVAGADYKAAIWNQAFFDNHAMPYGVLVPKESQMFDKDSMVRLRDQLEARHGGAAKHGRLGAVNVPIEFLQIGMDQKDMDFPTLLDKATEKLLMVWKVPPAVAGVLKDANYNAQIAQAKQFWHNHMPTVNYMEEIIYQGLCVPYSIPLRPYFKTEMVRALTEDRESMSNVARNFWNMGVPFDQINERLELGFEAEEHLAMQTSWVPFSLVNGDEQAMAPARSETGGPTPSADAGGQNQPGDESTVANDPTQGKAALGGELVRRMNWRLIISEIRTEEMAMTSLLRQHFNNLRQEVLRKLHAPAKSQPHQFQVDAVIFDTDKAERDVRTRTEPVVKSSLRAGLKSLASVIGIDFDLATPGVQKFLAEKMFEIADLVDGPAEERLRQTLEEAVRLGETVDQISSRVQEVFAVEMSRARRIARTEVAEAFNAGRYDAMKSARVQKIEWLTARDERVRDSHQRLDGDVVTLGDKFSNGLLYPLDPNGPPEEIVNCRCVALPA